MKSYSKTIKKTRATYEQLRFNKHIRKTIVVETVVGWGFISPVLLLSGLATSIAIIYGFILTFYQGDIDKLTYVGTSNWENITNPAWHLDIAFENTYWYAIVQTPIAMVFGLSITAIIRSDMVKHKKFWLTIFFLPTVTGGLGATVMFTKLFSYNGLNIGYEENERMLMWMVITGGIWSAVAGSLVGYNALFSTIDTSQYEAAKLDGIGSIKTFTQITLPSLGPVLSYSLMMSFVGAISVFSGPFMLAYGLGYPASKLTTLMMLGFTQIQPIAASGRANIGAGLIILFIAGAVMIATSFVSNIVFPISGARR